MGCGEPHQGQATAVRQYEIWWAKLPKPVGRRPVLLITRSSAYRYLRNVMVLEITTTIRDIRQEIPLGSKEGLRRPCVANSDSLHVIPKNLLTERISRLPSSRHLEVKRAVGYALDWPELKVL